MSSNNSVTEGHNQSHHGPIAPHLEGFRAWLASQCYKPVSLRVKLRCCRDLDHWLKSRNISLTQIDEGVIAAWLESPSGQRVTARRTGQQLLEWLRLAGHPGITPAPATRDISGDPVEQMVCRYERFLRRDRGLRDTTIRHHLPIVRDFLSERLPAHAFDPGKLTLNDVSHFLRGYRDGVSPGRVQVLVGALRSFFGHLFQCGNIAMDIAAAIPGVPNWRLAGLPKPFESHQVEAIVSSCDAGTAVGQRDYAILLLLARMGLRACEVVRLTLDDIDWNRGNIAISGKGNRRDSLPLPLEVGAAIANLLQYGRPVTCATRRLFVGICAPHRGFASSTAIGGIVRRALARSGVTPSGRGAAHRFRHSLATGMLRNGASLEEIGQVLRHNHPDSVRIYAKVDIGALRSLAPAWPGVAS